jgi:pectinesterase
MIKKTAFLKAPTHKVKDILEAVELAKALRKKSPKKRHIIEIAQSSVIGEVPFPFSNFYLKGDHSWITSTSYAKQLDEQGKEKTTWKTAALKVTGSHNIFEGIHVENSARHPEIKGQEVALGVYGDDNLFIGCHLVSTQDTLFAGPLPDDLMTRYLGFIPEEERYFEGLARNYFANCVIEGTFDFIFGAGQAVFYKDTIISTEDCRGATYIVAPSHSLKDDFGYLFYKCSFEGDNVPEQSAYLARPWRDYGKAVFDQCQYGPHVKTEGFGDWCEEGRDKTARFLEYPLPEGRVPWVKNKKGEAIDSKYKKAAKAVKHAIR